MIEKTYEQVCEEWGNSTRTKFIYKNKPLYLNVQKRFKDNKAVYIAGFYTNEGLYKRWESIHCDKLIERFKRFVDEHCTDWVYFHKEEYKGFTLVVRRECDSWGDNCFFGTCEIHKNSTFKCISGSYADIDEKFKARIDRVIEERTRIKALKSLMRESKEERIKRLEEQLASITTQLEEVKKEKETLEYKGVILEISKKKDSRFEGIILSKTKNLRTFNDLSITRVTKNFVSYIDELEEAANLYCVLTGKELK